jgi:hypothetical protein
MEGTKGVQTKNRLGLGLDTKGSHTEIGGGEVDGDVKV